MSVETKVALETGDVKSFSEKRGEPAWLTDYRIQSLELAERLPLPKPDKTKIDNWNFTQFTHEVPSETVYPSVEELEEGEKHLLSQIVEEQHTIVQRNGATVFSQISEQLKKSGVIFTDIVTAAREHSDLLKKYWMNVVQNDENRLLALHGALVNGGVFLYVPKNTVVQVPVQAIYSLTKENVGFFNHVIIVAEAHSEVTYVENYVSSLAEEEAVANIVAEVYAGPGAKVSFSAVDHFSAGVTTYVVRRAQVERDGKVEWALGQMNDGNTVSENTTHLKGDGSLADSKTVSVGRGSQKQNVTTQMYHHGKHTEGYMLIHGVMREEANSIFNGISKMEHGATKANGEQTERVLMLSEKARGDANPILLIDEDDVIAGHAASVGRIDPTQMYYLMSRGISKQEAERLIIHGFLAPVVNELPVAAVKERLVDVIERKVTK